MPNINKNIIMQAGAAVANATNKAAGLSASTPEPGAIISAIQLVNGGRTIGPDALAHFTESVRNKLLSLLVIMEPIQDLHGYAKPWPAGGGDNLMAPRDSIYNIYNAGHLIPVSSGEKIYVYGEWTCTDVARLYVRVFESADATSKNGAGTNPEGNYFDSGRPKFITIPTDGYLGVCYVSGVANYTISKMMVSRSPITSADDYSPYENNCPISGRTGVSVYVGPTQDQDDATTYAVDWTTPAGTVYAGSADIVSGYIKAAPYYASYNGETLVGPWVSSMDEYDPDGTPTTGAQVVDLGGTMTEYHITGQDIITLVGDNYIWSDSGDVTITE